MKIITLFTFYFLFNFLMANFHKTAIISTLLIFFTCIRSVSGELRPKIGAKALGMSGAIVSYSDEPTGAIWNPANLARLREGFAVYDLSQGAFLLSYPFRKFGSLGLSVIDLDGNDRFMDANPNNPIGTFQYGNNTLMLSYAGDFRKFMLGVNFGLNRTNDAESLWQPGYDIGGIMRIKPNLLAGVSLIDIAGTDFPDRDGNLLKTFRQQFTLGMTWLPEDYLQLGADLDTARSKLRLGTQINARWFSLRLGTIANFEKKTSLDWSAGCSIRYNNFQINYAYLDNPALTYKHLLSIGYRFGRLERKTTPKIEIESDSDFPKIDHAGVKSSKSTVEYLSRKYKVEIPLILAFVKTESSFNPKAVSWVGAAGLTQLMPATARELGLKVPKYRDRKKPKVDSQVDERFDPRKNLEAGVKYLSQMLKRYDGNYVLAVAAYNAGPGNVKKNVPLIDETEKHVGKVLNRYYSYKNSSQQLQKDLAVLNLVLD